MHQVNEEIQQRRSPRFKKKNSSGKSIIKLAQDLVAKKCGITKENEDLDDMTLQQYVDMYKQPLLEQAMDAIVKLTEVADEKKKKKKIGKGKKDKKAKKIEENKEGKWAKHKVKQVAPQGARV
jgi:hypothetical protein